jgi:1,4-dihydroxy-2-naphthoyl-CoA hydrolase
MADNMALVERVLGQMFPKVLGIKMLEASPERVRAELVVTADICTTGQTLHGGAIMTLADFLGASGTFLNLPAGAGTTTLESKTNFISPARVGDKVTATAEPVHKGKATQVWRTTVTREDGRLVAVVTQTQMVLAGAPPPEEAIASFFQGKSLAEQKAILAQLEHGGAAVYRMIAAQEPDEARKKELLRAAEREEENARTLEDQAD